MTYEYRVFMVHPAAESIFEAGLAGEHLVFEFLCECGAGERGDAGCEEQIEMTMTEIVEKPSHHGVEACDGEQARLQVALGVGKTSG